MFYVTTAQFDFDVNKIANFCDALPRDVKGRCFASAASRMIETDYRNIDLAVSLCESAVDVKAKDACFKELLFYSNYNFHTGSAEFLKICHALPESFSSSCLSGDTSQAHQK